MIFWGGIEHSSTSVILELMIYRSDTGQGMTGLTNSSSGLSIAHSYDNNAGVVDTSAATSSVETVAALYTYATPTAGFVRFREVDATNKPGAYQLMFENSVFAQASSKDLFINISGVTNMMDMSYRIALDGVSLSDINAELALYGVPTVTQMNARTQLAADYATDVGQDSIVNEITDVQGRLPLALSAAGNIKADILEVNDSGSLTGDGSADIPWSPP
jgi:hypothetical protein